jgi:surfeit locus 1 family protein
VLALLPCLLWLGVWQLHRADEKRALQMQFDAERNAEPIDAAQLSAEPVAYTRAQLRGEFDNAHSFLLDNRVLHGRVGYEVLTPFVAEPASTAAAQILIVNRGWIAGDPARLSRPVIPAVLGAQDVQGYIYREANNRLINDSHAEATWPRLIEQVDIDAMQTVLAVPLYKFTLRLDTDSPAVLQAEWPVVTTSPERHIAYAVQWFGLAAVLAVLWLFRSSNLQNVLLAKKDLEKSE